MYGMMYSELNNESKPENKKILGVDNFSYLWYTVNNKSARGGKKEMRKREYNNGKLRMMRKYREDRSISLRQLADLLDINYTTISHWENGKRTPDEDNAKKLEKFFDMSVDKLMEEIPEDRK